jgi:hypothetical protein
MGGLCSRRGRMVLLKAQSKIDFFGFQRSALSLESFLVCAFAVKQSQN